MATVRKSGKKNKKKEDDAEVLKATKKDYAVAKYIYNNVNRRVGDLAGQEVKCFYAEDAVNKLLDSQWSTGSDALFTHRQSCVDFCHLLLCKEMFHRAVLMRNPNKAKVEKLKSLEADTDTPAESGNEVSLAGQSDSSRNKTKRTKKKTEGDSKKAKKLKLEPKDIDQYFFDGREIYVWVYEPTPVSTYLIGSLILLGCIALCCYPLWPGELRTGVYYLSMLGVVFLGVIIFLAIFRYVVYYIILTVTFGQHNFFLFPNLTEDCGFLESFVPVFEYSHASDEAKNKKSKKKESEKSDEQREEPTEGEKTKELEELSEEIEKGDGDKDASEEKEGSGESTEGSTEGYDIIKDSDY